jgi:hypothetical protein
MTADLAHRERLARSKAIRLAQSVADIGKVLTDMRKELDARTVAGRMMGPLLSATTAISEIVESCAPDLFGVEPSKAARDVLAAHGWASEHGVTWRHEGEDVAVDLVGGAAFPLGFGSGHEPPVLSPAVLRAFATLAEARS